MNIQPEGTDKAHHIGPAEGNKQNTNIEFTKDSTASHIYQSHEIKDSRANHNGVKIKNSQSVNKIN